jgi:hypothetical protein
MAKYLTVSCKAHWLGPEYQQGMTHIGVAFSAGLHLTSGTAPSRGDYDYLLPQDWTISGFRVWGIAPGSQTPQPIKLARPISLSNYPRHAHMERMIRDTWRRYTTEAPAMFLWREPGTPIETERLTERTDIPWQHVLAQVGRYPAPLPHGLNLASIFAIPTDALAKFTAIVTLPEFASLKAGEKLPRPCVPRSQPYDTTKWRYEDSPTALPVEAHFDRALRPRRNANSVIDIQSLWLTRPQGTADFFETDWIAGLAANIVDAFDLPLRLRETLQRLNTRWRETPDEDLPPAVVDARLKVLTQAFLALLRDTADVGIRTRSDRGSLFRDVAGGFADRAVVDEFGSALRQYDQASERTLHWWAPLLFEADPLLKSLLEPLYEWKGFTPTERVEDYIDLVDRAYRRLREPVVLRTVVLAQWREVARTFKTTSKTPVASLIAHLERRIVDFDLHHRLLQGIVGREWQRITDFANSKDDATQARANIIAAATRHAESRFGRQGDAPDRFRPLLDPVAAELQQALTDSVTAAVELIAQRAVPSAAGAPPGQPDEAGADPNRTMLPHGISLPIDRMQQQVAADAPDYAADLAGIGVLIRRESGPWYCPNIAEVRFPKVVDAAPPSIPHVALVPVPLIARDDVKQALLTIDNQPFAAESPRTRLSRQHRLVAPAGQEIERAQIRYHNAYPWKDKVPLAQWARTTALVFGTSCDVAMFAVGACGALPKELAAENDPTMLADHSRLRDLTFVDAGPKPLPRHRSVRYTRKVPIGQIRLEPSAASDAALKIPADVDPIARELWEEPGQAPSAADEGRPALVLLVPKEEVWAAHPQTFDCSIRPPAVDLDAWDRWVAIDDAARPCRKAVWATVCEEVDRRRAASVAVGKDVTLDDQAALSGWCLELFEVALSGVTTLVDRKRYLWSAAATPSTATSYEALRVKAVQLSVAAVEPGARATRTLPATLQVSDDTPRLDTISLPPGVWELRLSSIVGSGDAQRFATNYVSTARPIEDASHLQVEPPSWRSWQTDFVINPLRLLVEIADSQMPPAKVVRDRIRFGRPEIPGQSRQALSQFHVSLDTGDIGKLENLAFKNVTAASVIRQVWHWDGRPLNAGVLGSACGESAPPVPAAFPFHAPDLDNNDTVRVWEIAAFGERPDNDHLRIPMACQRNKQARRFSYLENLDGDDRAHFFRFAVVAFSRYRGLRNDGGERLSWREPGVSGTYTEWKRHLVKCRRTERLQQPALRGVLPLTESGNRCEQSTPGVLVVLNEPWFEVAGLAERFEAEVMDATLVDDAALGLKADQLPEVGPDPIITARPAPTVTGCNVRVEPIGPIGHTFDATGARPLFGSTSFIIPAPTTCRPQLRGGDEVALDPRWNFAKLRFRRSVYEQSSVYDLPPSDWTDPIWVQFLPDASTFASGQADYDVTSLRLVKNGRHLLLQSTTGDSVKPLPFPSDLDRFVLFLLLTELISDAGGKRDHERFVGIFADEGHRWGPIFSVSEYTVALPVRVRARILEFQLTPGSTPPNSEATFWQSLFPENGVDGPVDATARIVRMSAPIDR